MEITTKELEESSHINPRPHSESDPAMDGMVFCSVCLFLCFRMESPVGGGVVQDPEEQHKNNDGRTVKWQQFVKCENVCRRAPSEGGMMMGNGLKN